jgi:hypothetical protein
MQFRQERGLNMVQDRVGEQGLTLNAEIPQRGSRRDRGTEGIAHNLAIKTDDEGT